MSRSKRWRVLWAALTQVWHEKQCSDCGVTWLAVGPFHHDLIDRCDDCAQAEMDRFAARMEWAYRIQTRKTRTP